MAGEILGKLSRSITCSICNKYYTDPRVLPCSHYFCCECIRGLLASGTTAITCPNCKDTSTSTTTECGSLESTFPPALVVNHLKLRHSRMAKLDGGPGGEGILCEMCSGLQATAYCRECEEFICSDCLSYHKKMKVKFNGHETYSLEDIKNGVAQFPKSYPTPSKCPEHTELFKLYCFDCCRLICRDCIVIDHANHHYEFVTKSITNTRNALDATIEPLEKLLTKLTDSAEQKSLAKNDITNQGVFIARHVHERFMAMIELLKKREVELLKRTESVLTKKMHRLNQQERDLHKAMAGIVTVIDYVKSHLDIATDEELLSVQHQLYNRVEKAMETYKGLDKAPVDTANLAVKINLENDLNKICREKAQVYLFPQFKKSHVHMAEINKKTTQLVTDVKAASDTPVSSVTAQLTSEVDGSVVKATVFKGGKGLYEITYTPIVRGRHKLDIFVNGEPIFESPFAVFATISPKQLGPQPLHVITGLKQPYGTMFDGDENLLITESNSTNVCCLMRDPDGKISSKHGQFADLGSSNPSGISADKEGNVYVTSASGHSITKYSQEGACLANRETPGTCLGELMHPCGLIIVNNEIYICDRNNCRVHVFSKDLVPLRTFGKQGKDAGELHWPYDLVQDRDGNLYITDCNNHRIQVFSEDGRFLREFGSRGSKDGKMKRPMGISLTKDGQYILVSEYDNHRVSVYQIDGKFVTSFGHYGTKEGEFCYPVGIAFDSDGFLYVCDQGNNRIQVY